MPLRVAIDANVFITGLVWPRWQHEILLHAVRGDFTLVLSPLVLRETRRRIRQTFPDFQDRLAFLLTAIRYEEAPVPTPAQIAAHPDLVRQAKDVPIALSIQAAQVDYFVTYDKDFTDHDESTAKVRAAIPGIILPPVFLRAVMGWTSEALEAIRHRNWEEMDASP
jgi:predicted nucleic acid-binding protein